MKSLPILLALFFGALIMPVHAEPTSEPSAATSASASAETGKPKPKLETSKSADGSNAAKPAATDIKTQDLVLQALALMGVTYKFGGKSPETGLDCSGLVRYVFGKSLQMALPHNAMAISKLGENIDQEELKPGDLVFFNTLKRKFSHVGIYLGDDRFIHAPSSGGGVQVVNIKEKYWRERFNGARRLQQADIDKLAVDAKNNKGEKDKDVDKDRATK
ncbi:cell wall-associated NlpC family hydrolase [Chitinivorax tropicus]|uniref:Cell wall-associated NlpC family hydrolase n=1 Tax=Chitinivorax tropicus TaxID=714531 RepID=A0A840MMD9_9PROT|nr:C40 family peptidase [Chitinivorax tropicus]MBB5019798.1 cell wall-associated NlpC family hydrolase [Chitinivorax tropicus]